VVGLTFARDNGGVAITADDPGRRALRRLGSIVASTTSSVAVAVLFVGGLVLSLLVPHSIEWLTRLQAVASIASLVLLFALHHTQHRDQIALQRKLDELIQATPGADNSLLHLESASDATLDSMNARHSELAGS